MNKKIASEIAVGIILLLAIVIGGIFWLQNKKENQTNVSIVQQTQPGVQQYQSTNTNQKQTQPIEEQQSQNSNSEPANTTCDNYECLIAAAAKCQPISVTISTNIPFPLNSDISEFWQAKYEINKSSGANDCILTFSSPVTIFSITDEGRKSALAKGMTDAQITAQLQTMNNSAKSELMTKMQSTCSSNTSVIVDYLTDAKNGIWKAESNGQTNTYTTSSGQKLACTIILPAGQLSNISLTIKDTECTAKNGVAKAVLDDGTACYKDQIDLGTIIGGLKLNNKYPQCCVSK